MGVAMAIAHEQATSTTATAAVGVRPTRYVSVAAHDDRDVVGGEAIGEALDGGLVSLGLLDEPQNPAEGRLGPGPLGLDPEQPALEHRRREYLVAGVLLDRHGFAGNGRLVDGTATLGDPAIHRDPLPGLDEDTLTSANRVGRHLDLTAILLDAGGLGGESQELADRLAGPLGRGPLEEVGEPHEEHDHGGRRVLADGERAEDAERHECMRGDGTVPKGARNVPEDRVAAGEDRREGEPPRDAVDQCLHEAEPLPDDPDEGHQRDDRDEAPAQECGQ